MKITMDCGCEFESSNGISISKFDPYQINLNCHKVWQSLAAGQTAGVWQLESPLGKSWTKKLRPENIDHLAALTAILRPGVLEALDENNVSLTEHYCLRKNQEEPAKNDIEILNRILDDTYNIIIYQEQAIKIAVEVAGFSESTSDLLRVAIGKKKTEEMSKLKQQFLAGAKSLGKVTDEEANRIFDIIEKSQRYSFNRCLSPTTVVETRDGFKCLYEIQIGDFVLAPSSPNHDDFVEVIDYINSGTKELFLITLESGKTLTCSIDHKILCEDGKIRPLGEILKKNLRVACQPE